MTSSSLYQSLHRSELPIPASVIWISEAIVLIAQSAAGYAMVLLVVAGTDRRDLLPHPVTAVLVTAGVHVAQYLAAWVQDRLQWLRRG